MIDSSAEIGRIFASAMQAVTAAGQPVPVFLAEAETDTYPYVVYDLSAAPVMTKDGQAGISAELTVTVISDGFDTASDVAGKAETLLKTAYAAAGMGAYPQRMNPSCIGGVWEISSVWNIRKDQ